MIRSNARIPKALVLMSILATSGAHADAQIIWGTPERVPEPVNQNGRPDYYPELTGDGLTMYYSPQIVDPFDIYTSTRQTLSGEWSEPVKAPAELLTPGRESAPDISADGLTILFQSSRPGGAGGGYDIWMATREATDAAWNEPVHLDTINTPQRESEPQLSPDGLSLYFDRVQGNEDGAIWVSTRKSVDAAWDEPEQLGPDINQPGAWSGTPHLSPDGLAMVFASNREDPNADLYITTRRNKNAEWGPVEPLSPEINDDQTQSGGELAADGYMYYMHAPHGDAGNGYDIWRVSYELPWTQVGDFNRSGEIEVRDLNMLANEVRHDSGDLRFDLTGDGSLNLEDHSSWIHDIANTSSSQTHQR